MKTVFLISCFLIALLQAGYAQEQHIQSENQFGEAFEAKGAVEAGKLSRKLKNKDEVAITLKGEVVAVCQKKGCWMDVDMGNNETLKVRFKDYGFFVPKDIAGRRVIIQGIAKKESLDVETLRHYAEDAGKSEEEISEITKAEDKYTFEATGVILE